MNEPRAPIDVEQVRFSAEWDAVHAMQRLHHRSRVMFVARDDASSRRALLAKSVLLSGTMAPEAHAMSNLAVARLGVGDAVELYQTAGRVSSARLALAHPIGIEFLGDYLAQHDADGVLAVIGHEIGHCLAHRRNPTFAWAIETCQSGALPSLRAYSMAAEITADRFGLLACQDIEAVLRLEMRSAAGTKGINFDTAAYLDQAKAVVTEVARSGGRVGGGTHPEHYIRAYAEWLFSESDVYAALTGIGPGNRRLADVDETVRALLAIPLEAEATTPLAVALPAVVRAETRREQAATAHDALSSFLSEKLSRLTSKRARPAKQAEPTGLLADFQEHVRRSRATRDE